MKLHFRLRNIACAALLMLSSAFLTVRFMMQQNEQAVYADDGTPIRTTSDEFFVSIYDQGHFLTVKTGEATVREVIDRAHITLAETDIVEPGLDTVIDDDFNINIHRARPAIVIDGMQKRYVMTASYDPKQIAQEAGLTVYDGDTFELEFNNSFLEAGAVSTYRLERNGGRSLTMTEPIPYTTEIKYDYNLAKGETYLERAGEDGQRKTVYEVSFANNVEVERNLVSEETVREPVAEIKVVGAKLSVAPGQETCLGWLREAGVGEADLEAALYIIYHESGCRVDAENASSGAYGIPQALPGYKMQKMGDDWQTNPITQIRWMIDYVNNRYGGWQGALQFKQSRGWY